MVGETRIPAGEGGAGADAGTGPVGAAASWLSSLLNAPETAKRGGRIKGGAVKSLVWLGLAAVLGIGVMGLGDVFQPARQAGYPGLDTSTASSQAAADSTAGLGTLAAGAEPQVASAASSGTAGAWLSVSDLETMIEQHLERILSKIQGAGKVSVVVSLEQGATYEYGYDETQASEVTEERDANGGTRTVTQTNVTRATVVLNQGSASQPVLVSVDLPPLAGVVVVASGARDSNVKALLSQAVQTLYGVPAHRVMVVAGG